MHEHRTEVSTRINKKYDHIYLPKSPAAVPI